MLTTAFLYEVIFYGLIAAVTLPAIDLLVFLIRSGPRSGREDFGLVSAVSEAIQDSDPTPQHIVDHQTVRRANTQRQQRTETAGGIKQPSRRDASTPHGLEKLHPGPVFHENGYVASNGIMITPNVIGSGHRSMIRPANTDVSATPVTHPHAEYWSYGDTRFYEHL